MDIALSKVEVVLPNGRRLFKIDEAAFPKGTHALIRGASGKGKTTLLHLIAGLFSADKGQVLIGGKNLASLTDEARCELRRQHFGIIFQKLNLLEHLTALENVTLTLAPGKNHEEHGRESLQKMGLRDRADDRAAMLSLGEQQRVAVARVLAANHSIILADEPTSSLDDKNAELVLKSLLDAAQGRTLLVVSHDGRLKEHFSQVYDFERWT